MQASIIKMEELLTQATEYLQNSSDKKMRKKPAANKWSKKEILGHLIDSGINNLQRFTEIQFAEKPYIIRPYHQDALVKANAYQNADLDELCSFWLSLNIRIICLLEELPEAILEYTIVLPNGETEDLNFLIKDYAEHLEHHVQQIMN